MSVDSHDDTRHQCQDGQREGEEENNWFIHTHAHTDRHFAFLSLASNGHINQIRSNLILFVHSYSNLIKFVQGSNP